MSHLNSGRLNLSLARDVSRSELLSLLDNIEGTKSIVWDPKLTTPFGLIIDYILLKEHKVVQMLELRGGILPNINAQNLIYLIRPCLFHIDLIAENIKLESNNRFQNINLHLIFVPQISVLCEQKLETLGVYGDFSTITHYAPDFFNLDYDTVSLEWPLCLREFILESDYSFISHAAHAIMSMQCLYGVIQNISVIGQMSKMIYDNLMKLNKEIPCPETGMPPQIDHLILIDRSIDLLTPMMHQISYEGLLDEIYGINQTLIRLPPEKFVNDSDKNSDVNRNMQLSTEMKSLYLNSGEELFKKLRDAYYLTVGPILRASAKSLSAQFDERKLAKSVREIRQFVDKMPYLQKLRTSQANHTSMAELIRDYTDQDDFHEWLYYENEFINCLETDTLSSYIESCISRKHDIVKVLRLISIQSFCGNGIKQKTLDFYKREIVQTYGYPHMLTFLSLEKAGVIVTSGGYGFNGRSYSSIRNRLKLTWNTSSSTNSPTVSTANNSSDIGHFHNGYTPLTIRIFQHLQQFGFRSLKDMLSRHLTKSDIPLFEHLNVNPNYTNNADNSSIHSASNQKLVFVFFAGGCTFSEISSLRFLSQKDGVNTDYLVGTTSIVNGRTLLQSLVDVPLK